MPLGDMKKKRHSTLLQWGTKPNANFYVKLDWNQQKNLVLWSSTMYKGEQDSQICMPTYDSFWVPNEIDRWSTFWKFQLSISLGTQKESHMGIHIWESCSPFYHFFRIWKKITNEIVENSIVCPIHVVVKLWHQIR